MIKLSDIQKVSCFIRVLQFLTNCHNIFESGIKQYWYPPYKVPLQKVWKMWIHFLYSIKTTHLAKGVGLWCLMPLSTIFQLYHGGQFLWGGNLSTQRIPPTCCKSLTTLSHNVVSTTSLLSGIQTDNDSDDRHWLHR